MNESVGPVPPAGYVPPKLVVCVQFEILEEGQLPNDGHQVQLGAFASAQEARRLLERLKEEGQAGLSLNFLSVHETVEDWEWDR